MKTPVLKRRRFLVAAITFASAAVSIGPSVLLSSKVWAASDSRAEFRSALATLARLLYPHDTIADQVYAEVLDQALSMVARDTLFEQLLLDAEAALPGDGEVGFAEASPQDQISALKSIEHQPYFSTIVGAVSNRLYSHPKIWDLLGYAGPSFAQGGYLHRGAGDINWLPGSGS